MSSEIVVKPKTSGMYFTQETENAVIEYNYDSCIILSLIYSQFI